MSYALPRYAGSKKGGEVRGRKLKPGTRFHPYLTGPVLPILKAGNCPDPRVTSRAGGNIVREAYDRVKGFIQGPRKGPPPQIREFLAKNGNQLIRSLVVCRVPIYKVIDKALNLISLGQWQKNKDKYHFDDLFHLYTYVTLADGKIYRMEKNQVVQVRQVSAIEPKGECRSVGAPAKPLTLGELFKNGEAQQSSFWNYNPVNNNCQVFVMNLLQGSGLLTKDLTDFIKQCAECVLNGYTSTIAKGITNLAGRADILLHGKGWPAVYNKKDKLFLTQ